MSEMIRVVYKKPGRTPRMSLIRNELKALQDRVDGYIETVSLMDNIVMVVNEEGKLKKMQPNFLYGFDTIVGPAVFVATERDKMVSLTYDQIVKVEEFLKEAAI